MKFLLLYNCSYLRIKTSERSLTQRFDVAMTSSSEKVKIQTDLTYAVQGDKHDK